MSSQLLFYISLKHLAEPSMWVNNKSKGYQMDKIDRDRVVATVVGTDR